MSFIRGEKLLNLDPDKLFNMYGFKIIHQSWKSTKIPDQHKKHVLSWSKYHPEALHVLWTDCDNENLIKRFYPKFYSTYQSLDLVIQKCDLIRLLYLHRYGGVYADLDYEAHQNIFPHLPKNADVMIVESPVLLNEVMQNSLMISRVLNHPLWLETVKSIVEIKNFIQFREKCFANKWGGCRLLNLFHNPLTKKVANMVFTLYITGPAVIDKTFVRFRNHNWKLKLLPKEYFFIGQFTPGGIATHHQANSWVKMSSACPEIIGIMILVLIVSIVVACLLTALILRRYN